MTGTRLPMFPLSTVLFPGATMPLHVFEPRYRALMRDSLAGDHRFGVILIERGSEVGGGDVRAALGTRGLITKAIELPDGRWLLQVVGESVIEVEQWLPDDPYPVAVVRDHRPQRMNSVPPPPPAARDEEAGVLVAAATQRLRRARALLAEHGGAPPLPPDLALDGDGDAEAASWELCAAAPVSVYDASGSWAPRARGRERGRCSSSWRSSSSISTACSPRSEPGRTTRGRAPQWHALGKRSTRRESSGDHTDERAIHRVRTRHP